MQSEILKGNNFSRRAIGHFYEKIAAKYLLKNGFEILGMNLYSKYGEIDILAKKKDYYFIFEIKGGKKKEEIYERFSKSKIERLKKLAEIICLKNRLKFIFVDGIMIVAMEGTISVIHIKNILQQGC